jgi:hypothetical protein
MKKILERNRQMRNIAKAAGWKWEKAKIHSIHGDRANIRLGNSPNLIRNVEVAGDISGLLPMSEVSIVWKNNRPVVIGGGSAGGSYQTILQTRSDASGQMSGLAQWGDQITDGTLSNRTSATGFANCQAALTPFNVIRVEGIIWDVYNADLYSLYWLYGLSIGNIMQTLALDEPVDAGGPHTFMFPEPIVLYPGNPYYFGLKKSVASVWKDWNAGTNVFGDFMLNGVYYGTTNYLASYSAPIQLIYELEISRFAVQSSGGGTTLLDSGGGSSSPHAGSHEAGGSDRIDVTGLNGLLADPQTPLGHNTSHQVGGTDVLDVTGLVGLLANAQTPLAHKISHQLGGADALNVAGLNGLLADPQTPLAHKASHQAGGTDALDLTGLAGITAANVTANTSAFNGVLSGTENTVQKALDRLDDALLGSGSGNVIGPASSVTGHLAAFGGTTGKVLVDGGAVPIIPPALISWGSLVTEGPAWVANTAASFAWQITSMQTREILLLENISWYCPTSANYELHYLQGNLPASDWETLASVTGSAANSMVTFVPTRKFVIYPGNLYWFGVKKTTGTCIWGTKNTGSTTTSNLIVTGVYYGSSIVAGYTPAVTFGCRIGAWS